ncbi:hypothetical protein HK096_001498, partial [Nowakowskiella sp. JEL0078]
MLANSSSILSNWTAFQSAAKNPREVSNVLKSFISEEATLTYVPTSAGAIGGADVITYLKNAAVQSDTIEDEKIISRAIAGKVVVEESIITIFHNEIIDWLLPEVKPTNKRIVIPIATIAKFNQQDQLVSIHKYWDQGSILRQLGILPLAMFCKANSSETILPILGLKIVDCLEEPYNTPRNVLLKESAPKAAGLAPSQ